MTVTFGNLSPLSKARSVFLSWFTSIHLLCETTALLRSFFFHKYFPRLSCFSFFKFSFLAQSAIASSDESVHFMGESHPGEDLSEATSRRTGSQSVGPSSGRRRSLRQMAASFRRLIDEEKEEVGGNEGEAFLLEGGENGHGLGGCASIFYDGLGSSTLKTSHITQMKREFFIPSSLVIYTPGPDSRAPFPRPTVCLFSLPKCGQV
ncbi:UNVERIFIED_CONTAM: hypothetical protein Slati_1698900 [Sesamum latifolium]|uniref:Uncharacterized protein n=1 Tax=Sesamum latifolium TaxID=2727402 RepID=A0AAW2X071_9LAMI